MVTQKYLYQKIEAIWKNVSLIPISIQLVSSIVEDIQLSQGRKDIITILPFLTLVICFKYIAHSSTLK